MRPRLHLALILTITPAMLSAEEAVRADRSQTVREPEGVLRIYVGGVAAAFGEVSIDADSVRVREGQDRVHFIGGISLKDSLRSIKAETLVYDRKTRIARFRKNVEAKDKQGTLTAQRVAYDLKDHTLNADGQVTLRYPEIDVALKAEHLFYDARADSGRAVGDASAIRRASDPRTRLEVQAGILAFGGRATRVRFSEGVNFEQAEMRGRAKSGRYLDEEAALYLEGPAEAEWIQEETSVDMRADTMVVRFASGRIAEIGLRRSAEIASEVSRDGRLERRLIRAGQCKVRLDSVRIAGLLAWERVTGVFDLEDGAKTDLSGEEMDLTFSEDQIDSLTLKGGGSLSHLLPGRNEESRLSGGYLSIRFQDRQIERVVAEAQASCRHVPKEQGQEAVVLSGDRIELDFLEGQLQKVVGAGGVRGLYTPERKEESGEPED